MQQVLWKQRLYPVLGAFLGLLLVRLFFALYNSPAEPVDFSAILQAYLHGIRFDLATLPVILLPGFLIALAGFVLATILRKREDLSTSISHWTIRTEMAIHLLFGAFLIGLALSSAYNYSFNGRHLGWEFSAYFNDLPMLARSSIKQSPFFSILLMSLVTAFVTLAFWLPSRIKRQNLTIRPVAELGHIFLWLILLLIAGRGGFQASPIRTADALKTGNAYLDQLSLNGVFTVSRDLSDRDQFRPVVEREQAVQVVRDLLDEPGEFISEDYPLLRYMRPRSLQPGAFATKPSAPLLREQSATIETGAPAVPDLHGAEKRRPNIVLLILESGSASLLERNGGDPQILPFLNSLVSRSVYFDRFFASGGRSANGIFAMFAGLPDRAGRTILRSSQIQNRFGGLARLLKRNGYRTSFYHGGDAAFDNLDRVLPELGFDVVIGQEELGNLIQDKPTSTIGFDDRQVLTAFLEHLDAQAAREGPFFGAFFSQSTHHPFSIPENHQKKLRENPTTAHLQSFFAAARFMDDSIKEFLEQVKKRPYFKNTIFVIVADHSHHAGLNYLQDRHIPLFIYAPHFWEPELRTDIASQLDLLPTILALASGDQLYSSMGRDLTSDFKGNDAQPFAFFAGGSDTDIIGWIESNRILFKHFFIEQGVLLPSVEPLEPDNLAAKEPETYEEYLLKAQIFYQLARTLEKENSIWPDSVQLENIYRSAKTR